MEYFIEMRLCKLFGPFWKFWAAYWAHLLASRTDKTRHDGDMLNYRKLAFANELQFEMGNCFLDRLAYNQAIECILKTNLYEFPKSKKIHDPCFGNPNISIRKSNRNTTFISQK